MFTGYFAKCSFYRENGLKPVSIARVTPQGLYNVPCLVELAPSYSLIQAIKTGAITEEEYTEAYKRMLSKLDKQEILSKLSEFGDSNKLVLCCYEKPEDFCHRHIVADWLGISEYEGIFSI